MKMVALPPREMFIKRVKEAHERAKQRTGLKIPISTVYEIASRCIGYPNWDALSAVLHENDKNISKAIG